MNNSNSILKINNQDNDGLESQIIGFSEQQRPLTVVYLGNVNSPLKIFIIAGQHGNEKYARRAVERFVASLSGSFISKFPGMRLAILSNANPDGSSRRTRVNAVGIDLNRDHQRLDAEENRAIHSFVRAWSPDIIIDVHNYRSKRKHHKLAENLMVQYDICIDTPTHQAVRQPLRGDKISEFLKSIKSDLQSRNFSCERYAIIRASGRVRHSTSDVLDARNCLSLRYNTLTILLEGRYPTRKEGKMVKEHILSAHRRALYAILRWLHRHQYDFINSIKYIPSKGDRIPIRFKYRLTNKPFEIDFKNWETKSSDIVAISNYSPDLEITKYIELPAAYAVPLDKKRVIEILQRHGFSCLSNPSKVESVESYIGRPIKSLPSTDKSSSRVSLRIKRSQMRLENYLIFPIDQKGGHCLAVFLEPKSKYGLHRYRDLDLSVLPDMPYPILRVL